VRCPDTSPRRCRKGQAAKERLVVDEEDLLPIGLGALKDIYRLERVTHRQTELHVHRGGIFHQIRVTGQHNHDIVADF